MLNDHHRLPIVYLMRHGQTEWNVQGRAQGRLDSPLTDLGWEQAARHAERLASIPFTRAYSSPLGRARLTADRVLTGREVPLTVLDDLAELDWGDAAGLTVAERDIRFPDLRARRQADRFTTVLPGGERYATARPRAQRALQQLLTSDTGMVLIVGHEMINRLLRMELCGLEAEDALWLSHPQDVIFRLHGGEETILT